MKFLIFVGLVLCGIVNDAHGIKPNTHKLIETENGVVRGIQLVSLYQKVPYNAFRGIPYAQKPTGELRFKVFFHFIHLLLRFDDYFEKQLFVSGT